MSRQCGQASAKHTQFTLGSLGPFVTAKGLENMTTTPETSLEVNADLHRAQTAWAKPSFYSLAPNAASVWSNLGKTHANNTWLPRAHWARAEGYEAMTTTPETSLKVNADPQHAGIARAKPDFNSLTRNAPSVRPNQGKHAIHTWLSRAHLAQPRAAKPRQRHRRRR